MEITLENISKSVLNKLEYLKCPICLDIVENVRELPCRHIFCSNCLEIYRKDKDIITCPLCKKEISRRKILSRDAPLDTLCSFVKTLCDDVRLHQKTDIKTFFSNVSNQGTLNNKLRAVRESDEIIPASSDENIIPCTSKLNDKKKSIRKRNLNTSKTFNKNCPKPIQFEIKKISPKDERKKTIPKLGLTRKQTKTKERTANMSASNLKPQGRKNLHAVPSEKNDILKWLHDTRNTFERVSQTQTYNTQNFTPQDIDLPSVSQIQHDRTKKVKNTKTVQEKQQTLNSNKENLWKRTRSVENILTPENKKLRRHSLECTSPKKMKQYQNLQEMDNIENKLIIDIIEDEVLDVIDKEVSGECPISSKKNFNDVENIGDVSRKEIEFLDQLDDEILENTIQSKKQDRRKKKSLNSPETSNENKSKCSWQSIKKLKKTIGKTKVPKKLDISLQSTQKSKCDKTILQNRTVDFQKMEDYFSKAIPEMIEKNIEETPLLDETNAHSVSIDDKLKPNMNDEQFEETHDVEKDNDSDIYIFQTQPLTAEKIDPKVDKIDYTTRLANKLDKILQEITEVDGIEPDKLNTLLPSIRNIAKFLDKLEIDKRSPIKFPAVKIQNFSEKQIQTDVFSLDGFPITPSAAFKSLVHEDIGTQTDNFCTECPHLKPCETTYKSHSDNSEKKGISQKRKPKESANKTDVSSSKTDKIIQKLSSKNHMESSPGKIEDFSKIPSGNGQNRKKSVLFDSQIPLEDILEQCSTQFPNSSVISRICENESSEKVENENRGKSSATPASAIVCSLPQSNTGVNRKLLFEKTLQERSELEQTLKRGRSDNNSDTDDERPFKMKCSRFLQNDISIEFESESLNDNSQFIRTSDVPMMQDTEKSPGSKAKSRPCQNMENPPKTQINDPTQETLLNYCDDLIEKANKQVLQKNVSSEHNNLSQILSENVLRTNEKLNQSINKKNAETKTRTVNEKIKTQDLLKHYEELIDKANKQIEIENVCPSEPTNKKIQYSCSQIPTTSRYAEVFNPDDNSEEDKKSVMKTQDLLDHCNALIEKTTKQIARDEIKVWSTDEKNKQQPENDDDFFCQNLDRLDSVVEKENHKIVPAKNKFSESLFESCKENLLHDISVAERKRIDDLENTICTPQRNRTVYEVEKKKSHVSISDDEIFSDVDMVETTPQKTLSFAERISCSQVVNQNSRMSLKFQDCMENALSLDIVPPPPGFDDEVDKEKEKTPEKVLSNSERESENVIPNSLSPQRFEIPPPRRPLIASNVNSKNSAVPQDVATLSQQFMKVSPICREKSKNLNVIEMVRQSKFSPLTLLPKSNSPALTSTPKQKSILSYTKSNTRPSQETGASGSNREKGKPCVAFSRLSNAETLCIISLCNKNLVTRQDKFGPEVTHMIVSVDKHNQLKDHTIKFISAIAAGIWVLNIKWVQECLAKNCIVDEEPFEVLDITGTPSPRISRLTRLTDPLLKDFKFFLPRSFAQTSTDEVKNIIELLQGEVVSSIEDLTSADREKYTCIIISELVDTEDYTQYENWLVSHKLITVDINWLSLSVSRYKVLSLRPHLICSDDSIEELGYPSNLVVDVAPTLTQDVTGFD